MQLILLFIIAFLVRFIGLNQSLWLDEAVVAKVVRTIPFTHIISTFSPADFHPPLYYLFMSLWSSIFGSSEVVLRLPSVFFSLVAGWFVYKTGVLIKNKTGGLWSAAFFLFNPLIIYYSQEARMYMMAVMFLSGALYNLLLLMQKNKGKPYEVKRFIYFNLFSALSLWTFYGSAFFVIAMIATFMVHEIRWRLLRTYDVFALCIGPTVALLVLFPLLSQQISSAKTSLNTVTNWSLVLGKAEMKNLIMVLVKFTSGRLSWFPKGSYYALAGGWSVVVGTIVLLGAKKNGMMAFLFALPLAIGLMVSFVTPMMQYFRFLYCILPMSILIGLFMQNKKMGASMVMVVFVVFSFVYLLNPRFHREDWRSLSRVLRSDLPTYIISASSDPLKYYAPTAASYELRSLPTARLPEVIQVIPYVEDIYGFDHSTALTKRGCVRQLQQSFRGPLFFEIWICLQHA